MFEQGQGSERPKVASTCGAGGPGSERRETRCPGSYPPPPPPLARDDLEGECRPEGVGGGSPRGQRGPTSV
eukprot:858038-Alexandrium_andersonii.AAC.1